MATNPFRVGDAIHGFAGGHFGRDSYGCRRVEAVGADWIVTRQMTEYATPAVEMVAGADALADLAVVVTSRAQCEHDEPLTAQGGGPR